MGQRIPLVLIEIARDVPYRSPAQLAIFRETLAGFRHFTSRLPETRHVTSPGNRQSVHSAR